MNLTGGGGAGGDPERGGAASGVQPGRLERHQLQEGVLPGPGAHRALSLPRAGEETTTLSITKYFSTRSFSTNIFLQIIYK